MGSEMCIRDRPRPCCLPTIQFSKAEPLNGLFRDDPVVTAKRQVRSPRDAALSYRITDAVRKLAERRGEPMISSAVDRVNRSKAEPQTGVPASDDTKRTDSSTPTSLHTSTSSLRSAAAGPTTSGASSSMAATPTSLTTTPTSSYAYPMIPSLPSNHKSETSTCCARGCESAFPHSSDVSASRCPTPKAHPSGCSAARSDSGTTIYNHS